MLPQMQKATRRAAVLLLQKLLMKLTATGWARPALPPVTGLTGPSYVTQGLRARTAPSVLPDAEKGQPAVPLRRANIQTALPRFVRLVPINLQTRIIRGR